MPASSPPSTSEPPPPPRSRRCGCGTAAGASRARRPHRTDGEAAASEVIGFLLTFGILSMVLVAALFTFTQASEATTEQVVAVHADSIAHRVAGVAVEVSLFAERVGANATYQDDLDLPEDLEGRGYTVDFDATSPERVLVTVPSVDVTATAPLFGAGAPAGFGLCEGGVDGGRIRIIYSEDPDVPGTRCIHLENWT